MCRLCDRVAPICPWRAAKSLEDYFQTFPCDPYETIDVFCCLFSDDEEGESSQPTAFRAVDGPAKADPDKPPTRKRSARPGVTAPSPKIRP